MCGGQGGGDCNGDGACSNNGSGNESGNCFPAEATAVLISGQAVRMDELATGDRVAVRRPDGNIGYEPIYAW
jgi:hypothetical protein